MARFDDLPESVVADIMSRLPAESLVESKRVNSSWYHLISSLINNRDFVQKQMRNTKDKSSISLVFIQSLSDAGNISPNKSLLLTLTASDDGDKARSCCLTKELNFPVIAKEIWTTKHYKCHQWWTVVCHCDGILCLVNYGTCIDIMLFNPLLNESKLLPQSKNANNNIRYSGIGFGYDSKAKDYKIVRIVDCPNAVAEVYTLGIDTWKDISMPKDVSDIPWGGGLYSKGVCYWEMKDHNNKKMVLSFDICDEVFHKIPFPENSAFPTFWSTFSLWNDSIVLFTSDKNDQQSSFEVWIMGDYCDILKGCTPWIKYLVISPQLGYLKPLTMLSSEEILLIPDLGDQLLRSYNIRTKKLSCTGFKLRFLELPVCFYEKSVASLRSR